MSPELAFLFSLALRMACAAAFVVTASLITERAGPALGALVASLPVSAGPSYVFLALDHDDAFIAQGAIASLPMNGATILMCLAYVLLAQRRGLAASLAGGLSLWLGVAALVSTFTWTVTAGIAFNIVVFAISLPLTQSFRQAKMPLVTARWYDIPVRAALVATIVAIVVTLSNIVGPKISGVLALFPGVFSSLILILMPRIGGKATAALLANGQWGLIGFGFAIVALHFAALPLGRAAALSLALAICVLWNLGLFGYGRYRMRRAALRPSSPP